MQVTDFLGQPLSPGDYFTFPGAGNRSAEYGLILYQVVKLKDNGKVQAKRLTVNYESSKPTVAFKTSTISKPNKLVKVDPPKGMVEVFNNAQEHADLVDKWIHGQYIIDWGKIKVVGRVNA